MRRHVLFLSPLLAGVLLGGCAQRGPRSIAAGKSVSDSLTARDPVRRGRGPYHVWALKGKRGQRVVIDMTSSDFDAFVALRDADGFLIGSDDDGGDQLNARLRTILPRSGKYRIVASSIRDAARGNYTLTVGDWATPDAPPAGRAAALAVGEAKDGLLEPKDEQAGDGPVLDRWTFDARAGQRLRVSMQSSDLDSYLTVLGPDSQIAGENDDVEGGRDARVTFTARAGGRHTALASNYGAELKFGAYRITVSEAPAAAGSTALGMIGDNATASARLEDGDSTINGVYSDTYNYTPGASGQVTIDLRSTDFDAYLVLEDSAGNQVQTNDDSGGGRDSQIVYQATAGTLYRIRATSFGSAMRSGAYTLSVRRGP